jgi:hypothetical protein
VEKCLGEKKMRPASKTAAILADLGFAAFRAARYRLLYLKISTNEISQQ